MVLPPRIVQTQPAVAVVLGIVVPGWPVVIQNPRPITPDVEETGRRVIPFDVDDEIRPLVFDHRAQIRRNLVSTILRRTPSGVPTGAPPPPPIMYGQRETRRLHRIARVRITMELIDNLPVGVAAAKVVGGRHVDREADPLFDPPNGLPHNTDEPGQGVHIAAATADDMLTRKPAAPHG